MGLNNLLLLEHVHVSVMFSAKCLFHLLKQTTLLGLEQETPTVLWEKNLHFTKNIQKYPR